MTHNMIRIEEANVFIKENHLLRNIRMDIPEGAIFALMGSNGAGKTMLMKLITGVVEASSGTVSINGTVLSEKTRPEIFAQLGVLIETPPLYAHLTVYQNLFLRKLMLSLDEESIRYAITFCNLTEHAGKKIPDISLGTRQRLGLALAFMSRPSVMLLDEPSNTLDPQAAADFRKLVVKINRELGTTFLIASHNLEEVEEIATHLCFIQQGTIRLCDSIENLMNARHVRIYEHPGAPPAAKILQAEGIPYIDRGPGGISILILSEAETLRITWLLKANDISYEITGPKERRLKDLFYDI